MFDYWLAFFVFFKQKTAYEMRISDWSSDVCSSDLLLLCQAAVVIVGLNYSWYWILIAALYAAIAIPTGWREHRDYLRLRDELGLGNATREAADAGGTKTRMRSTRSSPSTGGSQTRHGWPSCPGSAGPSWSTWAPSQ